MLSKLPLFGVDVCMRAACRTRGGTVDVRNGKVTPEAVVIRSRRGELYQALLDQGRSYCGCLGRFGVSVEFSSRFGRKDVTRSGGNAAPCMDCAFFVEDSFGVTW
ncbi:hypothetical protein Taro_007688 [Colocasia esculenta]|uniref:Uncharacterized protein n=1 Tax=Colocasia esculenta TaxID=4460 RepID=A0A843TRX5_COLES|nr:hypothetical protein [Colocasia esculenta]